MTGLGLLLPRCFHSPILAILAIAVLASRQTAMGQSGGDLKKLAGVWHVVAEEFKGQARPREELLEAKSVLKVTGGEFVFETRSPDGKKAVHMGTVVLNESAKPKRLDWKGTGPKGASLERIGLYEITEKELKLVYVQQLVKRSDPALRPADFRTSDGDNHVVVTFRREPLGIANASTLKPAPEKKTIPVVKIPPTHVLQFAPAQRIEAILNLDSYSPNQGTEEWIVVVPRLPELDRQRNVSTTMSPAGTHTEDLSDLKRPLAIARVPAKDEALKSCITVQLTYRADLWERQLVPLGAGVKPPKIKDLSDEERQRALANTAHCNFEDETFQAWLDKHRMRRSKKEGDVEFAYRVFQTIRKNCGYEYHGHMDRHAANVCKRGKSDCGGLSILFVAAMRASGVPARVLIGRHCSPGDQDQEVQIDQVKLANYGGQHATAEFFAYGVGWVPADMSAGIKHDKSESGLEFFGRDRGRFLVMHVGEDLVVDTIHFGRRTIHAMQSPVAWSKGTGYAKHKETWKVRDLR